jgi:hypothetical protein
MLQGIALIVIAVATVTAWLIDQIRLTEMEIAERDELGQLAKIEARLAAIEQSLERRPGAHRSDPSTER